MSAEDAAAIEAAMTDDQPSRSSGSGSGSGASPSLRPASASASSSAAVTAADLTRHLLQFRYEPTRLQTDRFVARPKSFPKGRPAETFSKKQYMRAAHRFVVGGASEDALDLVAFADPDREVDWSSVELVIAPAETQSRDCPICLSPPVCPKITKCGHVYCFTCLLHYLSLSDRSWSRCPLCFDPVYAAALKSVETRVHRRIHEGEIMEFVLMRRFKDCVNAAPVSVAATQTPLGQPSASAAADDPPLIDEYTFSRISLTTDISSILNRELAELFQQREASLAASDNFSLTYIDQAEESIKARMESWAAAHPFWTLKPRSYEELKAEEAEKYRRRAEEKTRALQKSASILAQTEAWPDLPKSQKPAAAPVSKSAAASPPIIAAAPAASPSPLPSPSSSPSSSPPLVSASSSSSSGSGGAKSSSFFDQSESGLERQFQLAQKNERAAAAASASASASPAAVAATAAVKPGQSAQSVAAGAGGVPPDSVYYFYASADGQDIFLHSLSYRSLLLDRGNNVSALPPRIRGRVAHLDHYVVDSTVRGKFRFLSHLPLTTQFGMAIVEMQVPALSRGTVQAMAREFEADRKARATAARKQKELNKRVTASSKVLAEQRADSGASGSGGGSAFPSWQQQPLDAAGAFPDLASNPNPLDFASGAPGASSAEGPSSTAAAAVSGSSSSGSPDLRGGGAKWNVVAEKGMASSELWVPLTAAASSAAAGSTSSSSSAPHWGASAAPLSHAAGSSSARSFGGSHPPSLTLGSAGWARPKPAAASSSSRSADTEEPAFPQPSVNRHGQTTLLSTASGRRSYK